MSDANQAQPGPGAAGPGDGDLYDPSVHQFDDDDLAPRGLGDVAPGENHATARYAKLVQVVSSLYYGNRAWWIAVMKGAIAKNAPFFNRQRMLSRYPSDANTR